jgi:hypothetical protein
MAKFGLVVLASLAIVVSLTRGEEQQRPLKVASILVSVKMQKKLSFFFSLLIRGKQGSEVLISLGMGSNQP